MQEVCLGLTEIFPRSYPEVTHIPPGAPGGVLLATAVAAARLDRSGHLPHNFPPKETHMPSSATARLEARISPELHRTVKRAAEMQGRSLTDFIVTAVQEAAQRAIAEAEIIRLSLEDQQRFADALLAPAEPAAPLRRAMARHDKLLRQE